MSEVILDRVRKVYQGGFEAVKDFNLRIGDGEFIVLVGPSGCGKSTTLRMVAGLEEITGGTISIGDRVVNDVHPKDRDIAMVFQNYALYPHMSVYKNMAFALKLRKLPKAEIDKRVRGAAEILGIEHLLERKPKQLSGGQEQRVAAHRCLNAAALDRDGKLMDRHPVAQRVWTRNEFAARIVPWRRPEIIGGEEGVIDVIDRVHSQGSLLRDGHQLRLIAREFVDQ